VALVCSVAGWGDVVMLYMMVASLLALVSVSFVRLFVVLVSMGGCVGFGMMCYY